MSNQIEDKDQSLMAFLNLHMTAIIHVFSKEYMYTLIKRTNNIGIIKTVTKYISYKFLQRTGTGDWIHILKRMRTVYRH